MEKLLCTKILCGLNTTECAAAILCDKVKCIVWEAGGGERGLEDGRALACL